MGAMMGIAFFVLMGLAMLAVLGSLFGGLFVMASNNDPNGRRSNKFMQYRIVFQVLAVIFFAAAMVALA